MKIAPFGVEIWMNDYEGHLRFGRAGNREELLEGQPRISACMHR